MSTQMVPIWQNPLREWRKVSSSHFSDTELQPQSLVLGYSWQDIGPFQVIILILELETSTTTTTTVDLPRSRHRKLPAELNQQIFLCLNPAAQLKFIYGLGWDFYAMFRHKLLTKVCMKNILIIGSVRNY
jgi:hypothetical protein